LLSKPLSKPLGRSALEFLEKLLGECFCGMADTWRGNASLAGLMRASERSIRNWLAELVAADILIAVDDDTIRTRRRLILKDHPDAPRLIAELRTKIQVRFDRTSGINTSDKSRTTRQDLHDGPGKICRPDPAKFATESSSRNREGEASTNPPNPPSGGTGQEGAALLRQRPEPAAPARPQPQPTERDDLTPGQRQFLDSLTGPQRAAFDLKHPIKQAEILGQHKDGLNELVADLQRRTELWVRVEPVVQPPVDPVELIRELPDSPHEWAQHAAEDWARDFGGQMDRSLWTQFCRIAQGIQCGLIDPEAVADAYRQAMGLAAKNPGAVFWTVLKRHGLDESFVKAIGKGGWAS
jgi:hypothetical protein